MFNKWYLILVSLFVISGCSSSPNNEYLNAPKATGDKALVYLMRTNGHSMFNATYILNGVKVVSLNDYEFSWILAPEGKYDYSVAESMTKALKATLNFEAGKTYYLYYGLEKDDSGRSSITTKLLDEDKALKVLPYSEYKKAARQLAP